MITKLSQFLSTKGYLALAVREKELGVSFKVTAQGLYFACLIDDTEDFLKPGMLDDVLYTVAHILADKYPKYSAVVEGHAVIVTEEPTRTRKKCEGARCSYWMIQRSARRLMIFDDMRPDYYDLKPVIDEFLSTSAISIMLSQAKELFTPVNTALIIINILLFIVAECMGNTKDAWFLYSFGAKNSAAVVYLKEYWRLFTCAFLHFGVAHLLYNMVALLYLGRPVEKAFGSVAYAAFYVLCALSSSAVSTIWYFYRGDLLAVSAGASGAICGVAGGLAWLMIKYRKGNRNFSILRWLIFVGLIAFQGFGSQNVDNAAHIGGLVCGFLFGILFTFLTRSNKKHREALNG